MGLVGEGREYGKLNNIPRDKYYQLVYFGARFCCTLINHCEISARSSFDSETVLFK